MPQGLLLLQRGLTSSATRRSCGSGPPPATTSCSATASSSTSAGSQLSRTSRASDPAPEAKNICHHCKFVGGPEYFYRCTQKFISAKHKQTEDINKALFNIRNGLFLNCDKRFCVYCVQNCYQFPLKRGEQKTWVCPFCTVD